MRHQDLVVAMGVGTLGFVALFAALHWPHDVTPQPAGVRAAGVASRPETFVASTTSREPSGALVPAQHVSARDLHAVYEAKRHQPQAHARFEAFQAATACQRVMDGNAEDALDWNDLEFRFRQRMVDEAVTDRENAQRRTAAFAKLKVACAGFTRPNHLPSREALRRLRMEAAAAGSLPAQVIALVQDTTASASHRAAIDLVASTGDAEAFSEAIPVMLEFQAAFADAALRESSAQAFTVALELAACRLGKPCDGEQPVLLGLCAMSGDCMGSVEQAMLSAPGFDSSPEHERVEKLVERILQAVREHQLLRSW